MAVSRRNIYVGIAVCIGLLFLYANLGKVDKRELCKAETKVIEDGVVPKNSKFIVTRNTESYNVHSSPDCWNPGCYERNNIRAFSACDDAKATDWNAIGVHAMDRFFSMDTKELPTYNQNSLQDAFWFFSNASRLDQTCVTSLINLGLVAAKMKDYERVDSSFDLALKQLPSANSKEAAIIHLFWGLAKENAGNKAEAIKLYDKVRAIDTEVEKEWWGVAITQNSRKELFTYGTYQAPNALLDMVLYKWFAPRSIASYSLLKPGTQDDFITNRFMVLRKVLPPFVLAAAQRCYRNLIKDGVLQFGDAQSKRYVAYNERCSRFIHYQLTDMVRQVIAHNAKPSYTYFGGYKPGSTLVPHGDRHQCEFTISLNIEQYPHDSTWLLSLGKKPRFIRDDNYNGKNPEDMPPEDEIVDADLYAGDALLFMGRHLVHFRRGPLPEGQWTNQAFLHYVQDNFSKSLN